MSSYENYSRTSASYDATRPPQGLEIIRENLSMNAVPMKSQALLDAGCGTGQYAAALIDEVSHITAVDLNEAMLVARLEKTKQAELEGSRRVECSSRYPSSSCASLAATRCSQSLQNRVGRRMAQGPPRRPPRGIFGGASGASFASC